MPDLPNTFYVKRGGIRAFLGLDDRTLGKMIWDPKVHAAAQRSARMFTAIHLPGYKWPMFKRSQVLSALAKAEAGK